MLRVALALGLSLGSGPGDDEPTPTQSAPSDARPTRVEVGVALGDTILAIGSPTQLRYAPVGELRLGYGLARFGGLGVLRLTAPIEFRDSIATSQRQFAVGGGLGLRSMFVQRPRVRFGLNLLATVDRLSSTTRIGPLPGLDEAQHVQRRITHHAGLEFGQELGIPVYSPVSPGRGPTTVLTFGAALAFVFPIAARRSGSDLSDARYDAAELGVVGPLGGATALLTLGIVLGWDQ